MRRGIVIVGILLLVIGLILVVLPFLQSTSYNIPPYPSSNTLSPQIVGSGSMSVSWSGASSNTHVVVFPCSGGVCSAQSTPIVNQSGASGSFSFNVQGGSSYAVTEFGSAAPVAATITISGFTYGQIAGIALLVVGAALAVVGFRARPRGAPAEEPVSAPVESPAPQPSPSATPASPPVPEVIYGSEPSPAPAASTSAAGTRPSRTCGSCGTVNEPWITNCRKCKRPLASTSQ